MNTFPSLDSSAVMQYPAPMMVSQGVQAIRFLDGEDQRYVTQGRTFRSWHIQLTLLNESELARVENFFAQQAGNYSAFSFPDPFSATLVPNCRFGTPGLSSVYQDVDNGSAALWVVETNG